MKLRIALIAWSFLCISERSLALDPESCNAAANNIDDRLAAGNHPAQNIAIATQLRDGIMQSCAFLDEATLANMLQGLDMLLPGGNSGKVVPQQSVAEREVEREKQRTEAAARRAERDKRRAEARAREDAEQSLVSEVVKKPPTGQSAEGQLMSRSDTMWRASIVDWDVYASKARLLYETTPSREQIRLPAAARHLYVVEFEENGNIVQTKILQTRIDRSVTAGLVRGRDEIILQWHDGSADATKPVESNLERWSISGQEMFSRSPAPQLQGIKVALGSDQHFQLITAQGNLLYAATVPLETGPSPKTAVTWLIASVDGQLLDRGLIEHDAEAIASSGWFHSATGHAGLVLDVTSIGEGGIDSQLQTDTHQFGSAEVRPVVFSERRLYIAGGAETGAKLPAFDRTLMWLGLEKLEQSIMISGESTRLMDKAEGEYRVRDNVVRHTVAGRNRMVVTPVGGGHAVLVKNNHRADQFPPTHGLWLQEFSAGGARRDTYLNPDVQHLGSEFTMMAGDGRDNLYVAGGRHVLRLNEGRELVAYAESGSAKADIKAMAASGNSVWLFGEHNGSAQQQVWVERLQF